MSKGILQLATAGRTPLHLEYRKLAMPQQDFSADLGASELPDQSGTPFMTGAFDVAHGEY